MVSWVEIVKGLRSTDWESQSSHRGVKYIIGNTVNTIVITRYGARWVLKTSQGRLCKVDDCLTTMLYT